MVILRTPKLPLPVHWQVQDFKHLGMLPSYYRYYMFLNQDVEPQNLSQIK